MEETISSEESLFKSKPILPEAPKDLDSALKVFTSKKKISNGGWIIKPLDSERAANHMLYTQKMAKEQLAARGDYKRPVSTEQAPSAARVMAMTDAEIAEHNNRKLDYEKAQVWKSKEEADAAIELAEKRQETKEAFIIQEMRQAGHHNTHGDFISEGGTVAGQNKDKAVDAFMKTEAKLSPIEKAMIKFSDPEVFKGVVEPVVKRPLLRRILDAKWVSKEPTTDGLSWKDLKK